MHDKKVNMLNDQLASTCMCNVEDDSNMPDPLHMMPHPTLASTSTQWPNF